MFGGAVAIADKAASGNAVGCKCHGGLWVCWLEARGSSGSKMGAGGTKHVPALTRGGRQEAGAEDTVPGEGGPSDPVREVPGVLDGEVLRTVAGPQPVSAGLRANFARIEATRRAMGILSLIGASNPIYRERRLWESTVDGGQGFAVEDVPGAGRWPGPGYDVIDRCGAGKSLRRQPTSGVSNMH